MSHHATSNTKRHILLATVTAAIALAGISTATAQEPRKSPGEQAVAYRQSLYTVLAGNFVPLRQMSDGKQRFDQAEFVRRAERVAFLAQMLPEAFPAVSNGVAHTDAKPAIWSKPDDFKKEMQGLIDKSAALWQVAKSGDQAKIKSATSDTAGTCKSCHDKFKED